VGAGGQQAASLVLKLVQEININFKLESQGDQKNWTPFMVSSSSEEKDMATAAVRDKILFIGSVDPHRVIRTVPTKYNQHVYGETVALTQHGNVANISDLWKWGELRGGTTAALVEQGDGLPPVYLTLFHASNDPPRTGDVLRTYVFGAYTFCASAPHKILKISSSPIAHESMFQGPWTNLPLSFYHIDYVAFPMSFIADGDVLHLTYGKQDQDGWMAQLSLKRLLDSLSVVNDQC